MKRESYRRSTEVNNQAWYASVQDAGRRALVLGPFATEAGCRKWAYRDQADGGDRAKHAALLRAAEVDPRAWFYSWGMVKMRDGSRAGVLNSRVEGWREDAGGQQAVGII